MHGQLMRFPRQIGHIPCLRPHDRPHRFCIWVRDGLGVAALAAASVTDEFQILESRDGFPPLPAVGVALMLSDASHPLVDRQLAAAIQNFVSEYVVDDDLTKRAAS